MSEWRGIPREEVPWFPTIDAKKCIGCRECLTICKNGVLAFDEASQKSQVLNPYNCVVECRTCARLCSAEAILFPSEMEFTQWLNDYRNTHERNDIH
ncbi:MAG: ferredoxin family protein [Geobacteraceae bacterium]|nr:ferredoxin family protein [Geobacteraceae bacterium]